MKNEQGFTLVEMMLVLVIIAVLILITVPNVFKYSSTVDLRGCAAYQKMVMGAAEAYKLETNERPKTIQQLVEAQYLPASQDAEQCPGGYTVAITEDGRVVVKKGNQEVNLADEEPKKKG